MKCKITVALERRKLSRKLREIVNFLDTQAQGLRSKSINLLLLEYRCQTIEQQTIAALQADLADFEYQTDLADWDIVAQDGIDA